MTEHSERSELEEQRQQEEPYEERGGEAACWAHLVCPDCGAMESEGHRPECPRHDRGSSSANSADGLPS